MKVNILQYADDNFLGDVSLHNVVTIKSILRCFELVSWGHGEVCLFLEL